MTTDETKSFNKGEVDPVDFLRGIAKTVRDYRGQGASGRVMQMVSSDLMFDRAALELEATRSVAVRTQELLDASQIQSTRFLEQLSDAHTLLGAAQVELERAQRRAAIAEQGRNIARGRSRVLCLVSVGLALVLIGSWLL